MFNGYQKPYSAFEAVGLGFNPFDKDLEPMTKGFSSKNTVEQTPLVTRDGGILSWAHPIVTPDKIVDDFFIFLKGHGVDYVEGFYQYSKWDKEYVESIKPELDRMIEKHKMQYSYSSGDDFCFMDTETWEQLDIPASRLKWESNFMLEGMEVEVVMYGSEVLGVNIPEKVVLTVTESAPAVAGNTATNALKEAKLETGFVVKVPMFVNEGEKIIVNTTDGKYSSRA